MNVTRWWLVAVATAATALLFAWLGRLTGVSPEVLWTVGAAIAALSWTAVLVTVPWNVYYGARRVVTEQTASTGRGIAVRPEHRAEAQRIAGWMLRFAIGGHVVTAVVAAAVAYFSGEVVGYYLAGFFFLTTGLRPATAFFSYLRHRLGTLEREASFPRDDVETLIGRVDALEHDLKRLDERVTERQTTTGRELSRLGGELSSSLLRIEDAQAVDRTASRDRDDDLRRQIDRMSRQIEATLDGISDHQELLAGLRALVRMIRSE
jgi:hypothetical protein